MFSGSAVTSGNASKVSQHIVDLLQQYDHLWQ